MRGWVPLRPHPHQEPPTRRDTQQFLQRLAEPRVPSYKVGTWQRTHRAGARAPGATFKVNADKFPGVAARFVRVTLQSGLEITVSYFPQRGSQGFVHEGLGFLYPPAECMRKLPRSKIWASDLTLVTGGPPGASVSSLHKALRDTRSGREGDLPCSATLVYTQRRGTGRPVALNLDCRLEAPGTPRSLCSEST